MLYIYTDLLYPHIPWSTPLTKTVVILRGIPGSGKTDLAKRLRDGHSYGVECVVIVSADDFFMVNGQYIFDGMKVLDAAADCFVRFVNAFGRPDTDLIIVDNTNIRFFEVNPYLLLARGRGWKTRVVRLQCNPKVAATRTTHGVPPEVIAQMALDMEAIPALYGITEEVVPTG